jgi:hypothetical protein
MHDWMRGCFCLRPITPIGMVTGRDLAMICIVDLEKIERTL